MNEYSSNSIISCRGLVKAYGNKYALDGINLEVNRGKIIGLLGPNGSGKTTLIKTLCGLLQPTSGSVTIGGYAPSVETKEMISYLPDKMYYADWMKSIDLVDLFTDFYVDFDRVKCTEMCSALGINPQDKIKAMSKGTKEKLQLILAMSRKAQLYLLDEPIAGVDPAARDYILNTILTNYNPSGTVLISTHLISDVEEVLDEAIFIKDGKIILYNSVENMRAESNLSVDELFRSMFKTNPTQGGGW